MDIGTVAIGANRVQSYPPFFFFFSIHLGLGVVILLIIFLLHLAHVFVGHFPFSKIYLFGVSHLSLTLFLFSFFFSLFFFL